MATGSGKTTVLAMLIAWQTVNAIHALYEHYEEAFVRWAQGVRQSGTLVSAGLYRRVPEHQPLQAALRLHRRLYSNRADPRGEKREVLVRGQLPLFSNYNADGRRLARPLTLLIDSTELDSGDALSSEFRSFARAEIDAFKTAQGQRSGQSSRRKDH